MPLHAYLDVGCGNGRYLRVMADAGLDKRNVYGTELDENVVTALCAEGFSARHGLFEEIANIGEIFLALPIPIQIRTIGSLQRNLLKLHSRFLDHEERAPPLQEADDSAENSWDAKGLDKLYSEGCFAVSKKEWPQFRADLLKYQSQNGGKAYLNIGPKGALCSLRSW